MNIGVDEENMNSIVLRCSRITQSLYLNIAVFHRFVSGCLLYPFNMSPTCLFALISRLSFLEHKL